MNGQCQVFECLSRNLVIEKSTLLTQSNRSFNGVHNIQRDTPMINARCDPRPKPKTPKRKQISISFAYLMKLQLLSMAHRLPIYNGTFMPAEQKSHTKRTRKRARELLCNPKIGNKTEKITSNMQSNENVPNEWRSAAKQWNILVQVLYNSCQKPWGCRLSISYRKWATFSRPKKKRNMRNWLPFLILTGALLLFVFSWFFVCILAAAAKITSFLLVNKRRYH